MRTTVTIDDDLLEAARGLAAQRNVSIGRILSDLIRKGMKPNASIGKGKGGFPTFKQSPDALPITLEMVKRAEEDEFDALARR
jgi:hypothetical protein